MKFSTIKFSILKFFILIKKFFLIHLQKITANTMGWLAAIVLHAATIPSLIALMSALTDRLPNLEMILFIWAALVLLFTRAIILKDQLNIITIGAGFIAQAVMMAFILFK
jgi:hypothetical protein